MKSIRTKITLCLILTVVTALAASGISSIIPNYKSTLSNVEYMMCETAVLAAGRVEQELASYKNAVMDAGCIPQLSDPDVPLDDKKTIIEERCAMHNFQRENIIGMNGTSIFDGKDYSDREYVNQAMQGNVYVSEPLVSKITGELSIMVAAPLYSGGVYGSSIAGVIYFVPHETFLNDIVASVQTGENSRAYMLDKSGYTIADITLGTVMSQNIEAEAKKDPSLRELASVHAAMCQGKNGFGSYTDGETKMFTAYAPVNNTDGWSLAVTAPQINYLASTRDAMAINLAVIGISTLVSVFAALILANSISKPMKACAKRMDLLVKGDLETPVPKIKSKDETGMLAGATASLVEGLGTVIKDISYLMDGLANQNLGVDTRHEDVYVGSFQKILFSIRNMKTELSNVMKQAGCSAKQVFSASEQLSASAQTLSQGTVEQASSVQELAARINIISGQVKNTANEALDVRARTHHTGEEISICNQRMQELMDAMDKIKASSQEIEKILKTIDDIAFQTNILALNASVEASRAGSAGKGFAVIAGEVRNLAIKSAEAAKNTSVLIANSTNTVHIGAETAANTAGILSEVVAGIQAVSSAIDNIAAVSNEQSDAICQITEGINQISAVVQNNSATAQESAAASEQLSAEAEGLERMVGQFTISSM